jgi:GntP family gluconate:H+ symporter
MPLLAAALAVALLILLIARLRMNAFVAIVVASLAAGIGAGVPLARVAQAFQEGVGATLGFVAIVIGLGTILGKLLAESGGAAVVSARLVTLFGEKRLPWAIVAVAFVVGLPVFFNVGLVLLAPIVFTLAKTTGTPLMRLAIPLIAGLSVAHGLVPPHPGPLAAIKLLGADTGAVLFYSILVGIPCAIVSGPLFGRLVGDLVIPPPGGLGEQLTSTSAARPPSFGVTLLVILLPVLLMLIGTAFSGFAVPADSWLRSWTAFVGNPLVALLIATLVATVAFGTACGFDRGTVLRFSEECVGPVANVLLVVGAGGGFGKVLDAAGVAQAIAVISHDFAIPPLVLGWTMAALLRVAVGSATVAITTTASLMAPVLLATPGTNAALLVVAMGAGSLVASHVNDGGFWVVKQYFNLTVPQTLKIWTTLETIVSVTALILVLLIDTVIK